MKTCRDCVNYTECVENYKKYLSSRLKPDGILAEVCMSFKDKTKAVKTVVYCKDCKYYSVDNALLGNVCTRLFTVFPMREYDFCSYGEHKRRKK